MTLIDAMEKLYKQYGYYENLLVNFEFEGEDGMIKMGRIMDTLRKEHPAEIAGRKVTGWSDYQASECHDGEKVSPISLPKSNVLELRLANGSKMVVRPSGTEPKIKVYLSAKAGSKKGSLAEIENLRKACPRLLGIEK